MKENKIGATKRGIYDGHITKLVYFFNELTALLTMDLSNEAVKHVSRKVLQMNYVLDQTSLIAVIDQHGNISYVNRRLCELTNYSREDLINQPYELICAGLDC